MIVPSIRVLAVVCWILCVRNTASQASAPAPTLKFAYGVNASNIELHTVVLGYCNVPNGAAYPVNVSVGRLESPSQTPETTKAWLTSEISKSNSLSFQIPATAQYEGKLVCWYKSTRKDQKNPYSEFSNTVNFVVSALSPPKVTVNPSLIIDGGNYVVFCNSTTILVTNYTLTLYYRIPNSGTSWTLHGSLFLTNADNIYVRQTNAVDALEFACTMEMLYNGKLLHSPLSNIEQAIPETLPVQLWEQERGNSCLGYLNVKLKYKWEPVCQKEVDWLTAATTAEVACREVGCGVVVQWRRLLEEQRQFTNTIEVNRCRGEENKIRDCPVNGTKTCAHKGTLYIVCSDAVPPPKLSVVNHGPVSKLYVTDKQDVEISCFMNSTYLKSQDHGYYIFRKDGQFVREIYSRPGYIKSLTQNAPVPEGEYECVFQLYSSKTRPVSMSSNTIIIYRYNPPNPVPIVTGVFTTVIGVAIMVYICIYRTATEEVQSNEFPALSQDPETTQTNTENQYNNVNHLPQQM